MVKAVTPSDKTISPAKIAKIWDLFSAGLLKSGLPANVTQTVIEDQGPELVAELVAVVRKRVEAISDVIVRHVTVNRTRSGEEALLATGRKLSDPHDAVKTMPNGVGDTVVVHFFKPDAEAFDSNGWISDAKLAEQFALRGLKPADPYSLAAINETDPAFADEHPNATHWEEVSGQWCHVIFIHLRDVRLRRSNNNWNDFFWYAGVRK